MNNNEIEVIERVIEAIAELGYEEGKTVGYGYVLALRGVIDSSKAEALPVSSSQAPASPKSEEVFNSKKITLEIEDRPTGKVVHWKVDERPDRNFDVTISGHVVGISRVVGDKWVFTPSGPKSAPRVKELVWTERYMNRSDEDPREELFGYEADACDTVGGFYNVNLDGSSSGPDCEDFKSCDDPDEAKAACQEDYTRRILSALEEL